MHAFPVLNSCMCIRYLKKFPLSFSFIYISQLVIHDQVHDTYHNHYKYSTLFLPKTSYTPIQFMPNFSTHQLAINYPNSQTYIHKIFKKYILYTSCYVFHLNHIFNTKLKYVMEHLSKIKLWARKLIDYTLRTCSIYNLVNMVIQFIYGTTTHRHTHTYPT